MVHTVLESKWIQLPLQASLPCRRTSAGLHAAEVLDGYAVQARHGSSCLSHSTQQS